MSSQRKILSGLQILVNGEWLKNHALVIEDNCIEAIIKRDQCYQHMPAQQYEFPTKYYLIPGLIDLHIHGVQGKDVMDGEIESLCTISRALAAEGVTGFL